MKMLSAILQSKATHQLSGMLLAALWGLFAYANLLAYQKTGEWRYVLFAVSETLSIALFIFRTPPKSVSTNPVDWLIGVAGTFAVLLLMPAASGAIPIGKHLIVAGVVIQIMALASLNRSFALVAAKREIKTRGMYRFVRHPMYASYAVIVMGYVFANTTWWNIAVSTIALTILVSRIIREEKHLALDAAYRNYMGDVRYRLIPFIY